MAPPPESGIPPGTTDSHFHSIEMARKGLDVASLLAELFLDGGMAGIDVAVDTADFQERLDLLSPYAAIRLSAGIAPSEAGAEDVPSRLSALRRQLESPRVVALGEIGLDWHGNYGSRELQRELFSSQLRIASERDLPVIIHNRDADEDTIELLSRLKPPRAGIMHCFSSDYVAARRFVDLGFLISFAGNLTYKHAEPLREAARRLPLASILLETDAPYLAPHPFRGKLNHPGLVAKTYEAVAELRSMATRDLVAGVRDNFRRIFGF